MKIVEICSAHYNNISFAFTEICDRSYGGGVLEILPGEVGNIMLLRIDAGWCKQCRAIWKKTQKHRLGRA